MLALLSTNLALEFPGNPNGGKNTLSVVMEIFMNFPIRTSLFFVENMFILIIFFFLTFRSLLSHCWKYARINMHGHSLECVSEQMAISSLIYASKIIFSITSFSIF